MVCVCVGAEIIGEGDGAAIKSKMAKKFSMAT